MLSRRIVILTAALALPVGVARAADLLQPGVGSFAFEDAAQRSIPVWFYAPERIRPTTPVLFVMHGLERNAQGFRQTWLPYAQRKRAILLVPEFSQASFPGIQYNVGDVLSAKRKVNPRDKWAFTSIEKIFDRVKEEVHLKAKRYLIYGHFAGAQFVHRMVIFCPEARIEKAVAANAGWYTMPDVAAGFPYGLKDSPATLDDLKAALQKNLTIMLGTNDTDENDPNLHNTPQSLTQGKNRLERGKAFYDNAQDAAKDLEVDLKWRLRTVRGVGHNNAGMARAAVDVLF